MRRAHAMRFGAEVRGDGVTCFRLWAPSAKAVELLLHGATGVQARVASAVGEGWFELSCHDAAPGQRYQWRIDGDLNVPDPASRSNPDGPHAASEVVDPAAFDWTDDGWTGRPWHDAVFYELHVGTFTPEGTFDAAMARLPALAELGVTAVQLMPIADFPGDFGWGYDGVLPFAPYHGYGSPAALKRFIQAAHRHQLMVFADVVYNHFGPDGNYLHAYAPAFFSRTHHTAWGAGLNFDGENSATVREFFIDNALYWLEEFRFDGLRFDAVHAMRDDSSPDILQSLSARVRGAFPDRHVHLVLENDSNDLRRLDAPGVAGAFDGQWSGDVHHTLHVLLTGERDGYYAEYDRPLHQLGRSLAHGFARQGGPHNAEGAEPRRDAEGSAPLSAVVNLLHNHDQIGNRAFGERLTLLADEAAVRLATAIVCLSSSTPLLFMGEEFGVKTPFLYFAGWEGELREAVREGRRREFAHFPRYAQAAAEGRLPDPCARETFEQCKLDEASFANEAAAAWRSFFKTLLDRRAIGLREWLPRLQADGHDFAVIADGVLQVRWVFGATVGASSPDLDSMGARVLEMTVNLSASPVGRPARAEGSRVGDSFFELGTVRPDRLGPWSGEWRWQLEAA